MTKPFLLALVMALTLGPVGCLSMMLPPDATLQTKLFAAVGDFNTVKSATAAYATHDSTPLEHAERILEVMEATDEVIRRVKFQLEVGTASESNVSGAIALIKRAQLTLNAYIVDGGAP